MKKKYIVMIGTSKETRGGISSVVKAYAGEGLFDMYNIEYISTHIDGTFSVKLGYLIKAIIALLKSLLQKDVSLIHIHTASNYSFWRKSIFFFIGNLFSKKIIFHVHGGGFADFYTKKTTRFGRFLIGYILKKSCLVIVLSDNWKRLIGDVIGLQNLVTLHNPIQDKQYFDIQNEPTENRLLFLGLIKEEKGIYDILTAMSNLQRKYGVTAFLDVCGVGEADELNLMAERLSLSGHIVQHGWISQGEVRHLLAKTTAFLLPSYIEGLPMSILEAMAAGVPVIASNVGGIPDLITDGDTGFLIRPGDVDVLSERIRYLIKEESARVRVGKAGKYLVMKNYNPEVVVKQLIRIYRSVLGDEFETRFVRRDDQ